MRTLDIEKMVHHISLGARSFTIVEGLHDQVDDQPVRRNLPLAGGLFDAVPLFRRDPDVLLDTLPDGLRHRFIASPVPSGISFCPDSTSVPARGFPVRGNRRTLF